MARLSGLRWETTGILCAALLTVGTHVNAQTVTTPAGSGTIDCTDVNIDYVDDPTLTEAERLARMDEAFQRSLSLFDLCQTGQYSGAESPDTSSGQTGSGQQSSSASSADAAGQSDAQSETQAENQASSGSASDGSADSSTQASAKSQAPAGSSWGPPPDAPPAQGGQTPSEQPPTATASAPPPQGTAGGQSSATSDLSGTGSSSDGTAQSSAGVEPTENLPQGSVASSDMTGTELPPVAPPVPSLPGTQDTASVDPGAPGAPSPGAATGTQDLSSNGAVPKDIPPADNDSVLEAQIRKAAINEKDPAVQKKLWNEYRKYKGLPTVN